MLFYANFVGFDKMFSSTQRKLVSLAYADITSFGFAYVTASRQNK